MSTWRERLAPIIAQTLDGLPADASLADKRKALRAAYPKGLGRSYWPYRVWLDECRRQLRIPKRQRDDGQPGLPFA